MADDFDLDGLLDQLDSHVATEMAVNPEIVEEGNFLDLEKLPIVARRWHRLDEVFAVMADLIGSTNLSVGKHPVSTAAIYEASTGGVSRIFDEFEADFVDIQGDGAFALFWGEKRFERAICAAVTVKTFSAKHLEPRLEKKWPNAPKTGLKVGVAAGQLLVKRVGVPRGHQEPVWAGKAVNYAAKCAQQAGRHELIVTGTVWDLIKDNDYLAVTCPCGNGPAPLWSEVTVNKISETDPERDGMLLTSKWCDTHGPEYCSAVLDGETDRVEAQAAVEAVLKAAMADSLRAKRERERRDQRNMKLRRRGASR